MLQKLAGEVARPDLKQRKKLQRAILRRERDARRARDEALRKGTGIQQPGGAGLPDADPSCRPPAPTRPAGGRRSRRDAAPPPDAAPPRDAAAAPESGDDGPALRAAQVLRLQGAVRPAPPLLRSAVPPVRRRQLRAPDGDGRPRRPRGARHRCAREDRLPGRDPALARRLPGDRLHAIPARRGGALRASRTSTRGRNGSRSTASTCATRRASSSCASGSTRRSRGSTSSSTTPARPCAAHPASTATSSSASRDRRASCPRPSARSCRTMTSAPRSPITGRRRA